MFWYLWTVQYHKIISSEIYWWHRNKLNISQKSYISICYFLSVWCMIRDIRDAKVSSFSEYFLFLLVSYWQIHLFLQDTATYDPCPMVRHLAQTLICGLKLWYQKISQMAWVQTAKLWYQSFIQTFISKLFC